VHSLKKTSIMKKLLLLSAAVAVSFGSFAQGASKKGIDRSATNKVVAEMDENAQKSTATGDTVFGRLNFPAAQLDTMALYFADAAPFDSGYAYGSNPYGDKGWAERYDFSGVDSGVMVIGAFAWFGGSYNTANNKFINFKVWNQGPKVPATGLGPTWSYNGWPNTTLLTSQNILVKDLGIDNVGGVDSLKMHMFNTSTGYLVDSFFIGYTFNYTWAQMAGDTIGLYTTRDNYRYAPYYFFAGTDSTVNVKNAAMFSDNTWHDLAFDNFQQGLHLAVFPIFVINYLSVDGITKNNFTLFGNYPNPATNSTNVKYAVKNTTEVTIQVMDVTGRTISSSKEGKMAAGEHTATINTSNLPAGSYVYLIRTSEGEGMAAQFTVAK
jgi:hypothetical protein